MPLPASSATRCGKTLARSSPSMKTDRSGCVRSTRGHSNRFLTRCWRLSNATCGMPTTKLSTDFGISISASRATSKRVPALRPRRSRMTEQETESNTFEQEYADLGATTQEAMDIAETSMDIVRQFVPDETLADRFRQKSVHSMGDIEFQHLLRFTGTDENGEPDEAAPIRAGARAVLEESTIVTDITMSKAGVTGRGHNCEKRKAIGNGAELAEKTGMTRTAASVLELDKQGVYDDAIAVIGNAPTAAFALADCIENGTRPARSEEHTSELQSLRRISYAVF